MTEGCCQASGEVFHFSEDPTIRKFVPRVAATAANDRPYLWAVDEARAPDYWGDRDREPGPRDRPQAADWRLEHGDLRRGLRPVRRFNDVVPHTYGTAPSGVLQNNRIWDPTADGFVTPDPVSGYDTTGGYDLTTGWGSPHAPSYIDQLAAH